jgi:hypothetical protein
VLLAVGQQHERHGVGQHGDDRGVAPGGRSRAGGCAVHTQISHERQRPDGAARERDPGRRDSRLQRDRSVRSWSPRRPRGHEAGQPGQGRASVATASHGKRLRPGPAR